MYFILNVCYIPFIPLSSKSSTFFQIFRGRNGRNEFLPLSSTRPEESHFFRKKLNPDNKSCVDVISCVSQLLPDRKPCWRFVRILWSSTWSRMCLQTMCSNFAGNTSQRNWSVVFSQTSVAFLENWCNVSQRPVPW